MPAGYLLGAPTGVACRGGKPLHPTMHGEPYMNIDVHSHIGIYACTYVCALLLQGELVAEGGLDVPTRRRSHCAGVVLTG